MTLAEHRQAERFAALKDAAIEAVGQTLYPAAPMAALLMDVSQRGFRLKVEGRLRAESLIRLAVDDLPALNARVVWVRGPVVGCEFIDAIGPITVVDMLRQRISRERRGIEIYLDRSA